MAEENNGNWWNQPGQSQGDAQGAPSTGDTTPSNTTPQSDATPAYGEQTVQGNQFTMTSGENPTQTIPTMSGDATDAASQQGGNANAANDTPTEQYRPAPEFGAYGPVPQQEQANNAQSEPQQTPQNNSGNPFYGGNPFAPTNQPGNTPNNNGNNQYGPDGGNPYAPQNPFGPQGPSGPQGPNPSGRSTPPSGGKANGKGGISGTAQSVIVAVIAAVVAAALCLGLGYAAITEGWVTVPTSSSLSDIDSNQSGSGTATVDGDSVDWVTVAANVSDSVVAIQTTVEGGTAAGSGAIIDTDGHIVTNNHVISGAQNIQVTLSNGQIYTAQVVGTDTTTDLAVIQLDDAPDDLTPVEFADSDELAVGEAVMAIGNPLGYDDTATTGIVSALNRPVSVMDDDNSEVVTNAVQIDAAINPGNSGGPTFNAAGQVIGINSSIASTASSSDEAGSIGIGFAIPSNLVKRIAEEIIEDGEATHVALGVTITSSTVEADGVTRGGARITTPSTGGSAVVSGSPADEAGLRAEDTIVAYNGNAVSNNYSLLGYIRAAALGDTVTLTIVRSGETMDVEVTLDQEESQVNGTTSSDSDDDDSSSQDDDSDGDSDSDGYGFYDPFGLW